MNKVTPWLIAIGLVLVFQSIPIATGADSPEVHPDSTVTFRLKAPKADKVQLVGDWLKRDEKIEMKKGDDGVWTATAGPFPVGKHIYEFNVDGLLMADPINPAIKLRSSRSGSFVHVPGQATWEPRDVPHGAIEINYTKSGVLGDTLATYVYTPPSYPKNPDKNFPVLYLLHGSNDTAAGWTMAGGANFILDNLIAEGKAKEMIVVMPYGHAVPFGSPRDIQASNNIRFEEFLLKDVIPMVESKYRTLPGSANRGIAGLSMGGGQAIAIGFRHLDMFDSIGAFSAAVPNDFAGQFASMMATPDKVNKQLSTLWIGCGKDDAAVQRSQDLGSLLTEKGIHHTLRITDGVHNFETWRRYLVEFTPLLFRGNDLLSSSADQPRTSLDRSLQISDVPRHTQMGSSPAPEGAPGNGRYTPPMPANPALPTLWLIGDSTVRNGTLGEGPITEQWGWGAPIVSYFDADKINVVNRAFGGTSSRTFYNGFFWRNLRPDIKKGDFVLIQFGANDNGGANGKGALKGIGDETEDVVNNESTETVHTFGWYLRQFVKETREQGATPVICSLTPRKKWANDGHFLRDNMTHVTWASAVAKETESSFVDLYEIIAQKLESLGSEKADSMFVPSPTERLHTGWEGAVLNAECVVAGLKGLKNDPFQSFFSARAEAIKPIREFSLD